MRFAALATLLFLLTACGIPSGVLVAGYAIDSASYVGTGKTVSDYAISAATKKDCSVLYGVTRGKICEDAPVKQVAAPSDTRVPDRVPPGNLVPDNLQMVTEPMMLGDASTVDFDDSFANLATTKVSTNISTNEVVPPAKPQPAKAQLAKSQPVKSQPVKSQPVKSVSPAKTPL
ncbi:MAG: hypothetical protein HOM58_02800, partial [Rhodospirillaceae bacterium]|nr:hypothetical protein [Rhodospirillaceae bacterium]